MNDFFKSIKAILYDRITSPLYGTFIVSWLLWNWKIPYVTLFVSENSLNINKIDYIINNNKNHWLLIGLPLISTFVIITIIPLISNGAFWLTYEYDVWRNNKRNSIDRKLLLTLEQSIQLRTEIQTQEEKFDKLLKNKNDEIQLLKQQLEIVKIDNNPIISDVENNYDKDELNDFLNNTKLLKYADNIFHNSNSGYAMSSGIPSEVLNYFVSNNLIKNTGPGTFSTTDKGKYFIKEYFKIKNNIELT